MIGSGDEFTWEDRKSGRKLVVGGHSGSNDLYICRFDVDNALVPGRLQNGRCYVPHGGYERVSRDWATLKFRNS